MRAIIWALAILAAAIIARSEDVMPPTPKWLYEITRVAYTNLPNIQRLGDWPEGVIADFAKAGVQMMFSRAHSGEAWKGLAWKSAYGEPDPTMAGRDGTREIVALCRKHGIRYIAYYWAQREPKEMADLHPNWLMRNSGGKSIGYYCVNTPYRELVKTASWNKTLLEGTVSEQGVTVKIPRLDVHCMVVAEK